MDRRINYLAHLTLSHFDADLQVGNFLGDLLRGKEVAALPPAVREGVLMHRAIDRLTDTDPDVIALNRLIAVRHGRYATVLSDIAFDYHLFLNWAEYGPAPFSEFSDGCYTNLTAASYQVPERIVRQTSNMVRERWLRIYTSPEGMQDVFSRLKRRVSRPDKLEGVADLLVNYAEPLNRTFRALFPRLQTLADGYRR